MSKGTYPLKLPASIKDAAKRLAAQDGVSLNQFIAVAVAEKVGVMTATEEFFARRPTGAGPEEFLRLLDSAPDVPPAPGDDLEGGPAPSC
ncbi:pilus assembly protein HicB [Caenispirillum bisanense]|uniref:pilus assembly protein HicB n=1 Tax=Caenispirillum bisanense TaxID=414052 RepID=UPI0031DADBA0